MLSVTSARVQPMPMPRTERAVRRRFRPTLRKAYFDETQAISISERAGGPEARRSKRGPDGSDERGHEDGKDRAPHVPCRKARIEAHRPGEAGEGELGRPSTGEGGEAEAGLVGHRHEEQGPWGAE